MPPVAGARRERCRGYHAGRLRRNRGRLYPAGPAIVEEIVAVITGEGFKTLKEGAKVSYEIEFAPRVPSARNVSPL
jgi:hypothetical protein